MFPPLTLLPFYSVATMNGYKSISNSTYYPLAAGTIAWYTVRGLAIVTPVTVLGKFGASLGAASLITGVTAFMGNYTGRAIREIIRDGEEPPISSPPSFLNNGA